MRTLFQRSSIVLLALFIFFPSAVRALGPGGDVYFGYSRLGARVFNSNAPGLNGWEAAGQLRFIPLLGAEADVSHYDQRVGVPGTTAVLVGPRLTVGAAGVHLFAHGLVGVEHSAGTHLADDLGGGADFRLLPFFAWRVSADYIDAPTVSPSNADHYRFGTGIVFRF